MTMIEKGKTAAVYPRPRGGTVNALAEFPNEKGLSPPTRGNRDAKRRQDQRRGSIPAHAGEPRCFTNPPLSESVYPRPRGGTPAEIRERLATLGLSPPTRGNPLSNAVHIAPVLRLQGLSPPTRGNLARARLSQSCRRSIPAHAGEPVPRRQRECPAPVYPRPRGGTLDMSAPHRAQTGLSPPTRGNLGGIPSGGGEEGSIPAHAGEPIERSSERFATGVYPRPRGGTRRRQRGSAKPRGLSPPTRGNRLRRLVYQRQLGSIPAHAGEPVSGGERESELWVYPRPRGGTVLPGGEEIHAEGLSPPTRGNLEASGSWLAYKRSIPAHAGEPTPPRASSSASSVYPRPRGGTGDGGGDIRRSSGLSPPTRGNLGRRRSQGKAHGSIPAHAGEPDM